MSKHCTHCKRAFPLATFPPNKFTADGLLPWCPECASKFHKADDFSLFNGRPGRKPKRMTMHSIARK